MAMQDMTVYTLLQGTTLMGTRPLPRLLPLPLPRPLAPEEMEPEEKSLCTKTSHRTRIGQELHHREATLVEQAGPTVQEVQDPGEVVGKQVKLAGKEGQAEGLPLELGAASEGHS